jgi:hypothetical protein
MAFIQTGERVLGMIPATSCVAVAAGIFLNNRSLPVVGVLAMFAQEMLVQ